jgi:hypothetical protein
MAECNLKLNQENGTCTYEPCDRKGRCCECIVYHKRLGQLPGCLFSSEVERTFYRSIPRVIAQYR